MKKVCIYLTVFFYAFALFRPLTPLFTDILAHTFWKMEHLATIHFENGTYHLHAELETAQQEASKNPVTDHSFPKADESLSSHLLQDISISFPSTPLPIVNGVLVKRIPPWVVLSIVTPPPQA
jgi:hypothetical protein